MGSVPEMQGVKGFPKKVVVRVTWGRRRVVYCPGRNFKVDWMMELGHLLNSTH